MANISLESGYLCVCLIISAKCIHETKTLLVVIMNPDK